MAQHPTTSLPNVGDLVNPSVVQPPAVNQTPEQEKKLTTKWLEFLGRPDVKAGLLQFGINALQPVAPGRGALAHLGFAEQGENSDRLALALDLDQVELDGREVVAAADAA